MPALEMFRLCWAASCFPRCKATDGIATPVLSENLPVPVGEMMSQLPKHPGLRLELPDKKGSDGKTATADHSYVRN